MWSPTSGARDTTPQGNGDPPVPATSRSDLVGDSHHSWTGVDADRRTDVADVDLIPRVHGREELEELLQVGRLAVHHREVLHLAGAGDLVDQHLQRLRSGARLAGLFDDAVLDGDERLDRQQGAE